MAEKYLTRDQVKNVLNSLPPTSSKEDAINNLVKQGYKLEGLNDKPKAAAQAPASKAGGISLGNSPISAGRAIAKAPADFFIGGAKGVGKTILGMGQLGQRGLAALTGIAPVGGQEAFNQNIDAARSRIAPQGLAQKAGQAVEQVGEFFVPAGGGAKLATAGGRIMASAPRLGKVANILGTGLREGVEQSVRASAQRGNTEGLKTDFLTGALTNPALKTAGMLGKGGINLGKGVVSKLSGVPLEAMDLAFKNPAAVKKSMRELAESGEDAAERIVKSAEDAFNSVKAQRDVAYRSALEDIAGTVKTVADPDKVKQAFLSPLKNFGFNVAEDGSVAFGKKVILPKSKQGDIEEVVSRLNEWDDFSPLGIDDLRKVVRSYEAPKLMGSSADKQFNAIINSIADGLNDYTASLSPKIKKMRDAYAKDSRLLDEAMKSVSLGKDKPATAARKLLNVLNPKSDVYRKVLLDLGERAGKDLTSDVAGYSMSSLIPEGLGAKTMTAVGAGIGGMLNPAFLTGAVAASPRVIGEVTTGLGQFAGSQAGKALRAGSGQTISNLIKGISSQLNRKQQ
jgi:hypothetical protein